MRRPPSSKPSYALAETSATTQRVLLFLRQMLRAARGKYSPRSTDEASARGRSGGCSFWRNEGQSETKAPAPTPLRVTSAPDAHAINPRPVRFQSWPCSGQGHAVAGTKSPYKITSDGDPQLLVQSYAIHGRSHEGSDPFQSARAVSHNLKSGSFGSLALPNTPQSQ